MKKKNVIAVLAATALLVGCSTEIKAKPNYVEDSLVQVSGNSGNEEIYNNEFTDLYDALVDAGTSNSTIVDYLINQMAKKEIGVSEQDPELASLKALGYKTLNEIDFLASTSPNSTSEEEFQKLMDDYMVDAIYDGGYTKDSNYQEEKFAREQRDALYIIKDYDNSEVAENFGEERLLVPNLTFDELFPNNGRERYKDYREKVVSPIIYKRLLTAKYLYQNKYKVLGRAAARNVRAVELDNGSINDKTAANRTINNYIGGFLYAQTSGNADAANYFPGEKDSDGNYIFSVEAISNIWKGVDEGLTEKEKNFINSGNISGEKLYTRNSAIEEDLAKIADIENGHYHLKSGLDFELSTINDTVSKYTGSFAYPIDWGVTLAEREILADDIVYDDFYVERTGLIDFPSSIRSRLFSMSVENNLVTVGNTTFLMPEKKVNSGSSGEGESTSKNLVCNSTSSCIAQAANLYHYDAESSTYYVVIVDQYDYNTADLKGGEEDGTNEEVKNKAIRIATLLGENESYQQDALIHYFKEYNISYHDDDFYSYLESTYPDIFEEDE